ncbi:MAG: NTPase [Streptococcus mitis]|uniref:KAP family P-loop NTPase fold protein n=2 Tax=Streptococcus mitis TaxID=28037 RepID=UPI0021B6502C|nr:NTPase [Streptococcus mitis]MDU6721821.1 KAP family NTPase [Streptococcus mitis]
MYNSFSDVPTVKDEFKIDEYILGLSNFISGCETPLTLAIQGDWGTGKTSIMYQVEEKLKEKASSNSKGKIKTIFFNTWQYSQFDMDKNLAVTLITDLIDELEVTDVNKIENLKKSLAVITKSMEYLKLDFGLLNIEKINNQLLKFISNEEKSNNLKNLKQNLQSMIDESIKENNYEKIVIFIDDLDRLFPQKAIEFLEILKLFLDCRNCVFVLAIDYNVVLRGTKSKYGDDLDNEKGKAFFEKIIQVPFTVPVANYHMENFVNVSLEKINFHFDNDVTKNITQLIRDSIGNNPRSVNRLFNSVSLLMHIINPNNELENDDKLLIIATVCFQLRFNEAYDYLLTSYNNSPEDSEETKYFLIDLLENSFEIPDDADYNSLVFRYGIFSFKNQKELESFRKFFNTLKLLLKYNVDKLEVEEFENLMKKMSSSNTISTGNLDIDINKTSTQNHSPNEDVQFVIRKLFNTLVNTNHFDLSKPEYFGKENKEEREMSISLDFIKIANEYNVVRLTQGKGQGLNIYSQNNKSNSIYISGDTYGNINNDGIQIYVDKKLVGKINRSTYKHFKAKMLRENPQKYDEFEKTFINDFFKLLENVKNYI